MPEENESTPVPEGIEVAKPEIVKGEVNFMNKAGFNNPPPSKLKVVLEALQAFCAGLVTMVGATDLFTGNQPKVIMFILGIISMACYVILKSIGVKPAEEK